MCLVKLFLKLAALFVTVVLVVLGIQRYNEWEASKYIQVYDDEDSLY